jgi:hypothetical protein
MRHKFLGILLPLSMAACVSPEASVPDPGIDHLISTASSSQQLVKSSAWIDYQKYKKIAVLIVPGSSLDHEIHEPYLLDTIEYFKLFDSLDTILSLERKRQDPVNSRPIKTSADRFMGLRSLEREFGNFLVIEFSEAKTSENTLKFSVKVYDPLLNKIFFTAEHHKTNADLYNYTLTEQDAWDPLINVFADWIRHCAYHPRVKPTAP